MKIVRGPNCKMSGTELLNLDLLAGNSSFKLSNKKSYLGLSLIEFSDKSEENLLRSFYRDVHLSSQSQHILIEITQFLF